MSQGAANGRGSRLESPARQGRIPFQSNPTSNTMKFSKQFQRYESDHTKFIAELKRKDPNLEAKQQAGRALLWDKEPIDLDERKRAEASRVRQTEYVYYHLNKG